MNNWDEQYKLLVEAYIKHVQEVFEKGVFGDTTNESKQPECECGKEKHGFANHSRWCPKHE